MSRAGFAKVSDSKSQKWPSKSNKRSAVLDIKSFGAIDRLDMIVIHSMRFGDGLQYVLCCSYIFQFPERSLTIRPRRSFSESRLFLPGRVLTDAVGAIFMEMDRRNVDLMYRENAASVTASHATPPGKCGWCAAVMSSRSASRGGDAASSQITLMRFFVVTSTLCLKKTTMTFYAITSMHINRFW